VIWKTAGGVGEIKAKRICTSDPIGQLNMGDGNLTPGMCIKKETFTLTLLANGALTVYGPDWKPTWTNKGVIGGDKTNPICKFLMRPSEKVGDFVCMSNGVVYWNTKTSASELNIDSALILDKSPFFYVSKGGYATVCFFI
jgi:hypothetical protein